MKFDQWKQKGIREDMPFDAFMHESGLDPVVARVLYLRGVRTDELKTGLGRLLSPWGHVDSRDKELKGIQQATKLFCDFNSNNQIIQLTAYFSTTFFTKQIKRNCIHFAFFKLPPIDFRQTFSNTLKSRNV
jgi:hypothetical protein